MDTILQGISDFRDTRFPSQRALYERLVRDGQKPTALIIACADSRVAPEHFTGAAPGELFVCRNAGNIVPPFAAGNGGVSASVEYAVAALGVTDIIVCGHSDCGAMKGVANPGALESMPNVAAWLRHSHAAGRIVCEAYPADLDAETRNRVLALENVLVQLNHLRTYPSVATGLALGQLRLHGWYFEIDTGDLLAFDGVEGRFVSFSDDKDAPTPVAENIAFRVASPDVARRLQAAE